MKQTRRYFTHDALLDKVRTQMQVGLKRHKVGEIARSSLPSIKKLPDWEEMVK